MKNRHLSLLVVLGASALALGAGCGDGDRVSLGNDGRTLSDGQGGDDDGEGHPFPKPPAVAGDAGQTPTPETLAGLCAESPGGARDYADLAEARAALVGAWATCAHGEQPFGIGGGGAGLEFTADGRWYELVEQGGRLVRGLGFDQTGTWFVDFEPGDSTIYFFTDSGGGLGSPLTIGATARQLRLSYTIYETTFVAVPPPAADAPLGPTPSPEVLAELCSRPEGGAVGFVTIPEAEAAYVGAWATCPDEDGQPFGVGGGAGLEMTADKKWYVLVDRGGQLVRGGGFYQSGTWFVSGYQNARPTQINFHYDSGGGSGSALIVAAATRKMRLDYTGYNSDFVGLPTP